MNFARATELLNDGIQILDEIIYNLLAYSLIINKV